jgi:hypothetical protein
MSRLLKAIYDCNLCTYYLLPLIRLNKFSFGQNNFIQCYVSRDGLVMFVEVLYIPEFVYHRADYLGITILPSGGTCVSFDLPIMWQYDVRAFMLGRYTELTEDAKECIYAYSGLAINQPIQGSNMSNTDSRILAMDPDPQVRNRLRVALSRELDVDIPIGVELISVPTDSNYIDNAIITNTLGMGSVL